MVERYRWFLDIVLHMGAHRSGTTALQTWLGANTAALAAQGIAVWGPDLTRAGLFAGLIRRPCHVTDDDRELAAQASDLIRQEIDRLRESGHTCLIVTEENMIGTMRNNITERRLYPDAKERLRRIDVAFGGAVTHMALGIRCYDTLWASAVSFSVARGHGVPSPDAINALVGQPRGWRDVIRSSQAAVPDRPVTVWPFESFAGAAPAQLAAMVGRPITGLGADTGRRNRSPNADRLRRLLAERGDFAGAAIVGGAQTRWMPFTETQRAMMALRYEEDLAWLRSGSVPGVQFTESAGEHLRAVTEEEGSSHDGQKRGVG